VRRVVTALVLVALIPLAVHLSALGALTLATALMVVLIAAESIRYSEARERIRHEDDPAEAPPRLVMEEADDRRP